MKNYKKLVVWQKSMELVNYCYDICTDIPLDERYNLTSQIKRASVSIPSNIAEGSSRNSSKDYIRFLRISMGSCFELETQLLIAEKRYPLNNQSLNLIYETIEQIIKMIYGLINSINKSEK